MASVAGWHPHPTSPQTWAYWDGTRWLTPAEATEAGHLPPPGTPPGAAPPTPPAPGWWLASDGRWYPPAAPTSAPPAFPPPGDAGPTHGLAIASLVLSLLWLYGIGSILALAGIVIGWVGAVGAVLVTLVLILSWDTISSIDTDPVNGICNQDRWWQDPDCG